MNAPNWALENQSVAGLRTVTAGAASESPMTEIMRQCVFMGRLLACCNGLNG